MIYKKGKENNNADALSRSSYMTKALLLSEDEYLIDQPIIQFAEGVNEIQHIQCSMIEVAEEQAKRGRSIWIAG